MDEGEIYRAFGRRVATRRLELRLTQGALASAVGFSRASIANIEAGRQKLPLHQVYRFMSALKLEDFRILLPPALRVKAHETAPVVVAISRDSNVSDHARAQIAAIYDEFETIKS